jgi:hypothetical protein
VRFLRAGFVTRAGAVRASSPPALRPGRWVLRLSAFGGAGNACTLPFARSAAWAESKRSVALASAAVGAPEGERLPTSGRFRAQTGCANCVNLPAMRGHGWMRLSALRLPAVFTREGKTFDGVWWCAKLGRRCAARTLRHLRAKRSNPVLMCVRRHPEVPARSAGRPRRRVPTWCERPKSHKPISDGVTPYAEIVPDQKFPAASSTSRRGPPHHFVAKLRGGFGQP